jgi:hypothetical protein
MSTPHALTAAATQTASIPLTIEIGRSRDSPALDQAPVLVAITEQQHRDSLFDSSADRRIRVAPWSASPRLHSPPGPPSPPCPPRCSSVSGGRLLVGGIGIANVMVIAVLEHRSEIGLRRILGAARRHVAVQFLTEALILDGLGDSADLLVGAAVTAALARTRHWSLLIPPFALWGGLALAVVLSGVAGLYPAVRATRLSPTEALRTS